MRRPEPMRQPTDHSGRDLGKGVGVQHLNLVEPTDHDIGKSAVGMVGEVDVVGNRPRLERFQDRERRTASNTSVLPVSFNVNRTAGAGATYGLRLYLPTLDLGQQPYPGKDLRQ
jgi:hypothetical protein